MTFDSDKSPWLDGLLDALLTQLEPECEYTPGTPEYKEYAEGFCWRITHE